MLHMIVSTHSPETCPITNPTLAKTVLESNQRMPEVAKKLGVAIQGAWTHMGGHVTFMLVDAPNAHVLNEMGVELKLMNWNTSVIHPILTMQEALGHLK